MGRWRVFLVVLTAAISAGCAALPETPVINPRVVRRLGGDPAGFSHEGAVLVVAVSPDGTRIATGGADGTVRAWDAGTGVGEAVVVRTGAPVRALCFTEQGKYLAAGGDNRAVDVFAVGGWNRVWGMTGLRSPIHSIKGVGDGPKVFAWCAEGSMVLERRPGEIEYRERQDRLDIGVYAMSSATPKRHVDGALAGKDGGIRISRSYWNVDYIEWTKPLAQIPNAHQGAVTALVTAPGKDLLFSSGADGAIRCWNLVTLASAGEVTESSGDVLVLALAPDCHILWSGCSDGTVVGYDIAAFLPATMEK